MVCTSSSCSSCPQTFSISGSNCVCTAPLYYSSVTKNCQACSYFNPGCKTCTGNVTCTACLDGSFIQSAACASCPQNCTVCSGLSNCSACKTTFVVIGGVCACNNTNGQYLDSVSGNCLYCSLMVLNCQVCNTGAVPMTCSTPSDGFYVNGGGSCSACMPSCLTCSTASTCDTCPTGYIKDVSNLCVCPLCTCSDITLLSQGCAECDMTPSTCTACSSGTYLVTSPNQCSPCSTGCSVCTSGTNCLVCLSNFIPTFPAGACECNYNGLLYYYLGSCVNCTAAIASCLTC